MVRVEIVKSLFEEIEKVFKKDATKIFDLIETVANSPNKGSVVGSVGGIVIKELKYGGYRFYFLVDGFKLKFIDLEGLQDLLLSFVRMSNKKHQQKVIAEIRQVLIKIGPKGFE